MKVEEMQSVDQKEVDRRLRNYRLQRYLGAAGFALTALHLFFMLLNVGRVFWITAYISLAVEISVIIAHFAVLVVLGVVIRGAWVWIDGALYRGCDPYLMEACLYRTGEGRNRGNVKRLSLAMAQYYQGNFEQAWNTLQHVDPSGLKKNIRLNYYILRSSLCFRKDMAESVRELEDEFQSRIGNKEDAKNMQLLCAANNMKRAYDNKDYRYAYQFLLEYNRLRGQADPGWNKVANAYWEGILDRKCGNLEGARAHLEYAAKNGGRLFFAEEAKNLLKEDERSEETSAGEGGSEL